jgi:hypothetical protein
MRGKICFLLMAAICWTICWVAGFTKSDDANMWVQMAPWIGGGAWISITISAFRDVWRHRRVARINYLTKRSKELIQTANVYQNLGMRLEAVEAAEEASKLSTAALALIDGKEENACQGKIDSDT